MPNASTVATPVTWYPYALARPPRSGGSSLKARGTATFASSVQQWGLRMALTEPDIMVSQLRTSIPLAAAAETKMGSGGKADKDQDKAKQPCRLFANGRCTYGDKCRFSHAKGNAAHQQQQQEPSGDKSKKAKAKAAKAKAAAASDERVYPLFEVPPGSAGDPVPLYDTSHQTVEPGAKGWRHWPGNMSKLPADRKTVASAPTPGFNAQTKVSCGGIDLVALLDTGATCGSIAEWLFAEVYERVSIDVASGKYKWGDRDCPIREIGDFSKDPQSMMGFKKGTSIETRFFVVLRSVFTPAGKGSPHVAAVRLKVMPADSAGFPGIVVGLPDTWSQGAPAPGSGVRASFREARDYAAETRARSRDFFARRYRVSVGPTPSYVRCRGLPRGGSVGCRASHVDWYTQWGDEGCSCGRRT